MLTASQHLSESIRKGTKFIGNSLISSSDYLIKNTQPNPQPTKISDSTRARLATAHKYSAKGVKISAGVVARVVCATKFIGDKIVDVTRTRGNSPGGKNSGFHFIGKAAKSWSILGDSVETGLKDL